jgi:hypothetical protein
MRPAYSGPLATGSTPFRMQGKSYARSDSDRLKRAVLTGVCGQSATHGMVQPSQGSGLEAAILERRYFPRAIAAPRVAFEGLLAFALRRAHWAAGEARGALRHQPAWARPSATAQLHLHRAGCARLGGPDTRRRRGRARQRRGQPGRDQACQEGGRSLADCFSHTADTLTAPLDSRLVGQHSGERATAPLGAERAVLERVWSNNETNSKISVSLL